MSTASPPLRVLFCIGVTQNFFDLPPDEISMAWQGYGAMLGAMSKLPGLKIIGTMDDDRLMVGTSPGWPWTCYVLADAADFDTVAATCNLFRTTKVGDHLLWRYGRIEARVGRELVVPD
jgi:hypothetical protein